MQKTQSKNTVHLADLFFKHPGITDTPADIETFIDQQIEMRTSKLRSLMIRRKLSPTDIRQDFIVAIVEAMPGFDPARSSWRTYLSRVFNNRYCNFRRQYKLDRKVMGDIVALDAMDDDESDDLPTYEVDLETPIDINTVIEKLPARLRQFAELLKTNSPADVATQLNVTRSTVGRAMKRIREVFLRAGYEKLNGDATN
jgi:RNA polymerase sigma factor (sigma-70 family)